MKVMGTATGKEADERPNDSASESAGAKGGWGFKSLPARQFRWPIGALPIANMVEAIWQASRAAPAARVLDSETAASV